MAIVEVVFQTAFFFFFFVDLFCFVFPSLHKQIETLKTETRPLLGRAGSGADCIIRPINYAKNRRLKSR